MFGAFLGTLVSNSSNNTTVPLHGPGSGYHHDNHHTHLYDEDWIEYNVQTSASWPPFSSSLYLNSYTHPRVFFPDNTIDYHPHGAGSDNAAGSDLLSMLITNMSMSFAQVCHSLSISFSLLLFDYNNNNNNNEDEEYINTSCYFLLFLFYPYTLNICSTLQVCLLNGLLPIIFIFPFLCILREKFDRALLDVMALGYYKALSTKGTYPGPVLTPGEEKKWKRVEHRYKLLHDWDVQETETPHRVGRHNNHDGDGDDDNVDGNLKSSGNTEDAGDDHNSHNSMSNGHEHHNIQPEHTSTPSNDRKRKSAGNGDDHHSYQYPRTPISAPSHTPPPAPGGYGTPSMGGKSYITTPVPSSQDPKTILGTLTSIPVQRIFENDEYTNLCLPLQFSALCSFYSYIPHFPSSFSISFLHYLTIPTLIVIIVGRVKASKPHPHAAYIQHLSDKASKLESATLDRDTHAVTRVASDDHELPVVDSVLSASFHYGVSPALYSLQDRRSVVNVQQQLQSDKRQVELLNSSSKRGGVSGSGKSEGQRGAYILAESDLDLSISTHSVTPQSSAGNQTPITPLSALTNSSTTIPSRIVGPHNDYTSAEQMQGGSGSGGGGATQGVTSKSKLLDLSILDSSDISHTPLSITNSRSSHGGNSRNGNSLDRHQCLGLTSTDEYNNNEEEEEVSAVVSYTDDHADADVEEEEEEEGEGEVSIATQIEQIWQTVQLKAVWKPMAFVYLFNILQIPNVAWQSYLQKTLHFQPWVLGLSVLLGSIMTFVGILAYKYYFFKVTWRLIYIYSMLLTTFFSLLQIVLIFQWNQTYLHMSNYCFSLGDDVITAYISGIQFLPVCIMYMRLCPNGAEGASYAMLTTFGNIALVCANNLGRSLFFCLLL